MTLWSFLIESQKLTWRIRWLRVCLVWAQVRHGLRSRTSKNRDFGRSETIDASSSVSAPERPKRRFAQLGGRADA